jgi:predicted RNA-binding Zn ribbon-like protein
MEGMAMSKQKSGFKSTDTLNAAHMLVDLLNTRPHADKADELGGGSGDGVLVRFAAGSLHGGATDRRILGRLRDALALTLGGDRVETERAWSEVSRLTGSATARRVFTPEGVILEPAGGEAVLSGVAAAIQTVVEADAWSRIRICPNHRCDMAFYDTTRSRTQKWDSYDTCGNRANVSAHRARLDERQGK